MNTGCAAAWDFERHTQVAVVGGSESAVGAKLNPRRAELDIGEVFQRHGFGSAVGPGDWFVGETPVTALAIAAVNGAVGSQNNSGTSVIARERKVVVVNTAKAPIADLNEAITSAQSGGAGARRYVEIVGAAWGGGSTEH